VTSKKMMVRAANRMFSAISLGVFWRLAPSTMAIIRSRNVSPGLALILTISQSESTLVPPVTALRSPPLSRMTGALSPVMALSSTEPRLRWPRHRWNDVTGLDQDDVVSAQGTSRYLGKFGSVVGLGQFFRQHVPARFPQCIGLGFAAPFRHRFRKISEKYREPQP